MLLIAVACAPAGEPESKPGTASASEQGAAADISDDVLDVIPEYDEIAGQSQRGQQFAYEERVAACMADQGFEYIPYVPTATDSPSFTGLDWPAVDPSIGYGLSTFVGKEEELLEKELSVAEDDPNTAIKAGMSEAELAEYEAALTGQPPLIDPETMTEEEATALMEEFLASDATGCRTAASQSDDEVDVVVTEVTDEIMSDLLALVRSDDRMQAAMGDWSACMSDDGYSFSDRHEVVAELDARLNEIVSWSSDGDSRSASFEPTELQRLVDLELAMAARDLDCSEALEVTFEELYEEYRIKYALQNEDEVLQSLDR